MLKINRVNNDNEANDANDNGEELCVGLPETDVRHNEKFCCCVKSGIGCFWNNNDKCSCWNNDDCSRSKSSSDVSFKMMLVLAWSESREINSNLNDKLLKLAFLKGSTNNKPNRWKRMRKKTQMRFLCPWSNLILNSLVAANNNKRSELVRVMEVLLGDVGEEHRTDIGRTKQGFDVIDFESTQMHARLNHRCCCAVDPS